VLILKVRKYEISLIVSLVEIVKQEIQ